MPSLPHAVLSQAWPSGGLFVPSTIFFSYKQSNAYISRLYLTPLELHESPASSSSEHLHCSWKASVPSVPTHLLPQVSTALILIPTTIH